MNPPAGDANIPAVVVFTLYMSGRNRFRNHHGDAHPPGGGVADAPGAGVAKTLGGCSFRDAQFRGCFISKAFSPASPSYILDGTPRHKYRAASEQTPRDRWPAYMPRCGC